MCSFNRSEEETLRTEKIYPLVNMLLNWSRGNIFQCTTFNNQDTDHVSEGKKKKTPWKEKC